MYPLARDPRTLFVIAAIFCHGIYVEYASAQSAEMPEAQQPGDAIAEYLESRGLDWLLADQLQSMLSSSPPDQKAEVAQRLGTVYIDLLGSALTPQDRKSLELRATALLTALPDGEISDLRVALVKAQYLVAERITDRVRLGMATADEQVEAERILSSIIPDLKNIGQATHRRVEALERREERVVELPEDIKRLLADFRRVRSISMYYLGWSRYHLSSLSGNTQLATDAILSFGWLLNASGGREPSLDRLPDRNLRFDHVARSAIGVALCQSALGEHVRAIRWLDAVERNENTSQTVLNAMLLNKIIVYSNAGRWRDVLKLVNLELDSSKSISPTEARLLAILSLEVIQREGSDPIIASVSTLAMSELVRMGEVGHVLDIANKFGTAPLPGKGFVVSYVRGLQTYERGREALGDAPPSEPAQDPDTKQVFADAAKALFAAIKSTDSEKFPIQRSRCHQMAGLALFYAGDFELASSTLWDASKASNHTQQESTAWYAIAALDQALKDRNTAIQKTSTPSTNPIATRRAELASEFVRRFPRSERTARLLLARGGSKLMVPSRAIDLLLSIPPGSPLHRPALDRAASLLYAEFRNSQGTIRSTIALRYIEVIEPLADTDASNRGNPKARSRAINLYRRLLGVLLEMPNPDIARAADVLRRARALVGDMNKSSSELESELSLRSLQIAQLAGDQAAAEAELERLHLLGSKHAIDAERMLYTTAAKRLSLDNTDLEAARQVVRYGSTTLESLSNDDPSTRGIRGTIAAAAASIWEQAQEPAMLNLAVRTDTKAMRLGQATAEQLMRLGNYAESSGALDIAIEAWLTLMSASAPPSERWYKARFESVRLISITDSQRARNILTQHALLNDSFGPPPWGPKLEQLATALGVGSDG